MSTLSVEGSDTKRPFILGICGPTCCGKSTVCGFIGKKFKPSDVQIISQDNFYKGGDENTNFDHPDSIEFTLLISLLKRLMNNETVEIPNYDFATHSRTNVATQIQPSKIIIIEGILIFHIKELRDLFDCKVFINAHPMVRAARRLKRDVEERGRTREQVEKQLERDIVPSEGLFVLPHIDNSDMVLLNNKDGHFVGLVILESYIATNI